ncbi:MAG: hypothetical protein V7776_21900 [Halopseudomonas aestusnigri]
MPDKWKINKDGTATFTTKKHGDISINADNFFTSDYKNNLLGVSFWDDDISDINTRHEKYHEYGELVDLGISTKEVDLKTIQNGLAVYPTPFGPVFAGPGFVEQTSANPNVVTNYTSGAHSFYPGIVQRSIVVKNGGYHIRTVGIGIGILPRLNEDLSDEVWGFTDERLKNWVHKVKNNNGIRMIPTYPEKIDYSGKNISKENIHLNEGQGGQSTPVLPNFLKKNDTESEINSSNELIVKEPEEIFANDVDIQKRISEDAQQKRQLLNSNDVEAEDFDDDTEKKINSPSFLNDYAHNALLHPQVR